MTEEVPQDTALRHPATLTKIIGKTLWKGPSPLNVHSLSSRLDKIFMIEYCYDSRHL